MLDLTVSQVRAVLAHELGHFAGVTPALPPENLASGLAALLSEDRSLQQLQSDHEDEQAEAFRQQRDRELAAALINAGWRGNGRSEREVALGAAVTAAAARRALGYSWVAAA